MNQRTKRALGESEKMRDVLVDALDDAKGIDIKVLDVRKLTDITDFMVVATGSSDRHVKTLSDRVLDFMQKNSWQPLGIEGEDSKNWILVDFVDVVIHIMRDSTRKHYDLESLWDETFAEIKPVPEGLAENL